METGNRHARSLKPREELDDAACQSTMPEQSSTSAFVAMIAANLVLLLMLAAGSSLAASLTAISGKLSTDGLDVSADGSVVVGVSCSWGTCQAFRWTHGDGLITLGYLPDHAQKSAAQGVSGDGSVVVGYSGDDIASSKK